MEDWVKWGIGVLIPTVAGLGMWIFNIGKTMGRMETSQKAFQDKTVTAIATLEKSTADAIARIEASFRERSPLADCQKMFREFSSNTANLSGKLDMVIGELQILNSKTK